VAKRAEEAREVELPTDAARDDTGAPLELVASDIAAAADALGAITGIVTSEDVLDRVFAEFCIGK